MTFLQIIKLKNISDKTGAIFSWICAVHCLTLPFLAAILPVVGLSVLANEFTEYVFIGISVLIALFSLIPAYFNEHGKMRTLLLFAAGISFIVFADRLFEENLFGKIAFVFTGAILITLSHFINHRLCLNCHKCCEHEKHRAA